MIYSESDHILNQSHLSVYSNQNPINQNQISGKEIILDIDNALMSDNEKILNVNMIQPSIHAHWLCIDGVQPMISENPNVAQLEKEAEKLNFTTLSQHDTSPKLNRGDMAVEALNMLSYVLLLFNNSRCHSEKSF